MSVLYLLSFHSYYRTSPRFYFFFFFFNDTATTEIYTLSLHDALPISRHAGHHAPGDRPDGRHLRGGQGRHRGTVPQPAALWRAPRHRHPRGRRPQPRAPRDQPDRKSVV